MTTSSRQYTEPLTVFGRPWHNTSVFVPLLTWLLFAGLAFALVIGRQHHAIPSGWTFWPAGIAAVLVVTALGFLFTLGGHYQGLIKAWCTLTPMTGGTWVLLAVRVGPHSGWLPILPALWIILVLAGTGLWINARKDQHNHEVDHLTGAAHREQIETARLARLHATTAPAPAAPVPSAAEREASQWQDTLAAAGIGAAPTDSHPDARITFFERVPNRAGFSLHLRLPADGSVSYDTVRGAAAKLELILAARMRDAFPDGVRAGSVRVQRARHARSGLPLVDEVYVHVDVRNILKRTLRMPEKRADLTPISIYEAFPVGDFADGETIYLTFAEIHAMMVGRTRMGKSNLLNVLTRQIGRCYDAVIWAYDGKGGRWLRPWLKPWLAGEKDPNTGRPLDRPVFDWAAIDLVEFERMVDAAVEASKARPGLPYASGSGWTATRETPWILILADELSEAAGSNGAGAEFVDSRVNVTTASMSEKLARLVRLGAGEGVSLVAAQQRGTVTSGMSGDGKSQIGGRILLPVKAGEAGEVLADADAETVRLCTTLRDPGSVVVEGFGHDEALPGKIYLFGERDEVETVARRAVLEVTHLRPVLDSGTATAIEKMGYSTRWSDRDRTAWMRGERPATPLMRWSAVEFDTTLDTAAAAGRPERLARTRAEQYGLGDVPDPFAPKTTAAPAPAPRMDLDDEEAAARWAAAEEQLTAQYVDDLNPTTPEAARPEAEATAAEATAAGPAQTAPVRPLRRVEPTFDNVAPVVVEIARAAGETGITAGEIYRILRDRNLHPQSRGTVNSWCDRLADEYGKLVKPSGSRIPRYYTSEAWNHRRAASA